MASGGGPYRGSLRGVTGERAERVTTSADFKKKRATIETRCPFFFRRLKETRCNCRQKPNGRTVAKNVPQFASEVLHGTAFTGHLLGIYSEANQIRSPSATAAE